jgi:hypothetical protein
MQKIIKGHNRRALSRVIADHTGINAVLIIVKQPHHRPL